MKITISPDPVVIIKVDMVKFEKEFKKGFVLEEAFMKSFTLVLNRLEKQKKKDILKSVYLETDWGQIFKLYHTTEQKEMELILSPCVVENMPVFVPDTAEITFEEAGYKLKENRYSGQDLILSHTFIPLPAYHIERFLALHQFDYGNIDWKKKVSLG